MNSPKDLEMVGLTIHNRGLPLKKRFIFI